MRKTKSMILEAVHETAKGLYDAGVMDKVTMREFDQLCVPAVEALSPEEIKQLRESFKLSQAVFASMLNIKTPTVQKWEIGAKKPSGAALKLLRLAKTKGIEILMA